MSNIKFFYGTDSRPQCAGNAPARRRQRSGNASATTRTNNSTPAHYLLNENPSLTLSGKNFEPFFIFCPSSFHSKFCIEAMKKNYENRGFGSETLTKPSPNPSKIEVPKNMKFHIDFCSLFSLVSIFDFLKISVSPRREHDF